MPAHRTLCQATACLTSTWISWNGLSAYLTPCSQFDFRYNTPILPQISALAWDTSTSNLLVANGLSILLTHPCTTCFNTLSMSHLFWVLHSPLLLTTPVPWFVPPSVQCDQLFNSECVFCVFLFSWRTLPTSAMFLEGLFAWVAQVLLRANFTSFGSSVPFPVTQDVLSFCLVLSSTVCGTRGLPLQHQRSPYLQSFPHEPFVRLLHAPRHPGTSMNLEQNGKQSNFQVMPSEKRDRSINKQMLLICNNRN